VITRNYFGLGDQTSLAFSAKTLMANTTNLFWHIIAMSRWPI
jgi:hypothetical protein